MDVLQPTMVWVKGHQYRFYECGWIARYIAEGRNIKATKKQESSDAIKETPRPDIENHTEIQPDERKTQERVNKRAPRPDIENHMEIQPDKEKPEECANKEAPRPDIKINPETQQSVKPKEAKPQERSNAKKKVSRPGIIELPDLQPDSLGKYHHSFYVARRYLPFVIGTDGCVVKRLNEDSNTTIRVPRRNVDGDCAIEGPSKAAVVDAIIRINGIVEKARTIIEETHFISVPLTDETTKANFVKFRDSLLDKSDSEKRGLHFRVFQRPDRLHITLGTLLLVDDREIKAASEAFGEWKETIVKPIIEKNGPIIIRVEGLEQSFDNAVYGKVSSKNNCLQELADRTTRFFERKGLTVSKSQGRKLRVKLMSTDFGRRSSRSSRRSGAIDFPKTLEYHFFVDTPLKAVHLSERRLDCNGYFVAVTKTDIQSSERESILESDEKGI